MNPGILIDREKRHVRVEMRGEITYENLQGILTQLVAQKTLSYERLYDMRRVLPKFSAEELATLAHRVKSLTSRCPNGRTAVVVSSHWMAELMMMFRKLLNEAYEFQVFRTLAAGEEWLGWTRSESDGDELEPD